MAEVKWAAPALQQLEEILEYIALDTPGAAVKVGQRIFEKTDRLEDHPLLGQKIPEFPHQQYRRLWCKPCWVYYRIAPKTVFILYIQRAEKLFRMEDLLLP